MQMIIELPDNYTKTVMASQRMEGTAMDKVIRQAVIDGTPLPEDHGRLADADALIDSLKGIERLHADDELRSSILGSINANILAGRK